MKNIGNCITFLSFYLCILTINVITHKKSLNPLLNLLTNCKSAKYAPQILSIKGKCTVLLLNFLIISLCNSSVNSFLEIFLYIIFLLQYLY